METEAEHLILLRESRAPWEAISGAPHHDRAKLDGAY